MQMRNGTETKYSRINLEVPFLLLKTLS